MDGAEPTPLGDGHGIPNGYFFLTNWKLVYRPRADRRRLGWRAVFGVRVDQENFCAK